MRTTAKYLQLSYFSITHYESWDAGMAHQFPLTSSFIEATIRDTGLRMFDLDQIVWSARNRIEYFYNTS